MASVASADDIAPSQTAITSLGETNVLLKGTGLKSNSKTYSNLVSSVAHQLQPGADFVYNGSLYHKAIQGSYADSVWNYLKASVALPKGPAQVAPPGWECNFTPTPAA
jgi:hypothetical protein